MANINELKEALKDTLEEKGVLNEVRAMMRQAIFKAIESDDKPKPKLTDENLIINELIREYMIYNNYLHSNSVFIAETGQPSEPPFDRNFIAKELNIVEENSSKKVPLLYSILFGLKKEIYQPNEINVTSNMNPMNMVESNKSTGIKGVGQPSMSQTGNMFDLSKDQPKPWVIE